MLKRTLIRSEKYEDRTLEVRHMGPDVLGFVNGIELSGFFIDVSAAIAGGQRYVDAEIKVQRERDEKTKGAAR